MAPPKRSERDPYDVDTLLDRAVAVFLERGYDATSMRDLAKAAEISPSSIYHHVSGKEELLERAVRRALDALFALLDEPEATDGPYLSRLRHIVRGTAQVVIEHQPEVSLLIRVRGNTDTERWALNRRREFDRAINRLIRDGMAAGEIRADIPSKLNAHLIFGMVNSISDWYRPRGEFGVAEISDAIVAVMTGGIAATGSAAARRSAPRARSSTRTRR